MTVLFPNTRYTPGVGGWGLGAVEGFPVAGDVSSLFGARDMAEHAAGHNGTDIACPFWTPILAPCDMLITDVFSLAIQSTDPLYQQIKSWFGNSVWGLLTDADGKQWRTMFAHMVQPPEVREGAYVAAGTVLGYVGATGMADGPHLHWTLGPAENRWLARDMGNVEALDYCATGGPNTAAPPATPAPVAPSAAQRALDAVLSAQESLRVAESALREVTP